MKKVLVRAYCNVNFGDDLFIKILIERYPNTMFYLITSNRIYKKLFVQKNIRILRLPGSSFIERIFRKIIRTFSRRRELELMEKVNTYYFRRLNNKVDGFIYIGGSIFMQQSDYFTVNNLTNIISKNISNNKFILSANFGPFYTKSFLIYHEEMFERFDDICFRDSYSRNLFKSFRNIRYAPDVAFNFLPPVIPKNKRSVGFSLIDVSRRKGINAFSNSYLALISQLVTYYIKEGYSIYLFSFCKNEGDEIAIDDLKSILPNSYLEHINTVLYDGNIQYFINIYGTIEYFYPTRFHSMVLSMLFKQKIFPLIYSEKMTNVLKDISYIGSYANINEIDFFNVDQIVNLIETNTYDIEDVCIDSEKQFKCFDEFLHSK